MYKYYIDSNSYFKLNKTQLAAKNSVEEKIKQGEYLFENTTCAVCDNTEFENLAAKDRYGLECYNVICKSCGLIYLNPRMTRESYSQFYQSEYRHLYGGHIKDYQKYFNTRYKDGNKIYDLLMENGCIGKNDHQPKVLDVGCGIGGILKYFAENGCITYGIDLGKEYIQYGVENYGLNLHAKTVHEIEDSQKYDVIIYSHVFEHIVDLATELNKIKRLLRDTGFIYIEVPGIYNLQLAYQNDFLKYIQNAHTFSFCLKSLENIMKKNDFELVYGDEHVHSIFKKSKKAQSKVNVYKEVMNYLEETEKIKLSINYKLKQLFRLLKRKIKFIE